MGAAESLTASAFDPTSPPSRCIDGSLGVDGACRVPMSGDSTATSWLQLNLFDTANIYAFRLQSTSGTATPGLLQYEMWMSNSFDQDYSDSSQRCYSGVADATFSSVYQPCGGQGRFVRLRLIGGSRSLTLASFELFSAAPFPTSPAVSLVGLIASGTTQQIFKSGQSAGRCVDGNTATVCGYDETACGASSTNSSTVCPVLTLALACLTYPSQLSESCAAIASTSALTCGQPIDSDPYVDFDLGFERRLRAIKLQAEAASADLGHYRLEAGPQRTALVACTYHEGVASDTGEAVVRPCSNDNARWVRVLLPGAERKLRLLDVELVRCLWTRMVWLSDSHPLHPKTGVLGSLCDSTSTRTRVRCPCHHLLRRRRR